MNIRCPHCHNPIDVVADSLLEDVTCPSCGSSFSLISGETTQTHRASSPRKLAHFELVRELGMGKFGSVWLARDTQLDRTVAIKIPRSSALNKEETELFLRDARAAAQLKHPSIVSVHEVGRDDQTIYIVSDYIEGANLREWLSAQRLSFREAAQLVTRIAEALEHAHRAGVVHRDLKPSNIMLDAAGQPHVIDFGLAKRSAGEITMTMDGHILGTPAYMPPEQAGGKGHEADARSDVYSLGVILFELLSGELPFRGETQMLLLQIQRDEPPRPRKLNARIPRDLETITLKCLEKDPGKRYQSAQQLADDLSCWLEGKPILARPIGQIARGWRWAKRSPAVASLTAAVAVALIAGTAISGYFAINESAARTRAQENLQRAEAQTAEVQKANQQLKVAQQAAVESERIAVEQRTATEQEKESARKLLYVANMNLAQRTWEGTNVQRVLELLEQIKPNEGESDLRGWEWFYQWRLSHSALRTIPNQAPYWVDAFFSPSGDIVAAKAKSGNLKLWDVRTGRELRSFAGQPNFASFNTDGTRLATADLLPHRGTDNTKSVTIWSVQDGTEVQRFNLPAMPKDDLTYDSSDIAISPNHRYLAMATLSGAIVLWEIATNTMLREIRVSKSPVYSFPIGFSPDSRLLAVSDLDGISIIDVEKGVRLRKVENRHIYSYGKIVFSRDGSKLVSSALNGPIVLSVADGRQLVALKGHAGLVTCAAFSPDGTKLASSSYDRTVRLWDIVSGEELAVLQGHTDKVTSVAFNSDGSLLVSAGTDNTLRVWDVNDATASCNLAPGTSFIAHEPLHAPFAADSRYLIEHSSQKLTLREIESGRIVREFDIQGPCDVAISLDGVLLAIGDKESHDRRVVKIWDLQTNKIRFALTVQTDKATYFGPMAFSPDGQHLAVADGGYRSSRVFFFSAIDGSELGRMNVEQNVADMVFSTNGERLVLGGDQGIVLCDAARRKTTGNLGNESTRGIAVSPDGRLVATAGPDWSVTLWDIEKGTKVATLKGHAASVGTVAFSLDGRRIVSTSEDNTVRIWDVVNSAEVYSISYSSKVESASFSSDGNQLAVVTEGAQLIESRLFSDDEKMARFLARKLCTADALVDDVLAQIEAQTNWTDEMRRAAVQVAERAAFSHESALQYALSRLADGQSLGADQLDELRRLSDTLNAREPTSLDYGRLRAVVRLRSDDPQGALDALSSLPTTHPIEVAIVALANVRLGHNDAAHEVIEQPAADDSHDVARVDETNLVYARILRHWAMHHYSRREWAAALRDFQCVARLQPVPLNYVEAHINTLAMKGRWQEAANLHTDVVIATERGWNTFINAFLQLAAGNEVEYRAMCAESIANRQESDDVGVALTTVLACVSGENAVENPDAIVTLAETVVKEDPGNPVFAMALGAAQFRAGRTDEAIVTLKKALPQLGFAAILAPDKADVVQVSRLVGEAILALAYHKQGDQAALEKQRKVVRSVIAKLKESPAESASFAPWASTFAIAIADRELHRLESESPKRGIDDDQATVPVPSAPVETAPVD